MTFTRKLVFLALVLSVKAGWAQIEVELTAPKLKPGMAALEVMLQAAAESFSGNIVSIIEPSLSKPLFMQAFTGATITASLLPGQLQSNRGVAFSMGSAASVWSANYSEETITSLKDIGMNTDLEAGTCIMPLLAQFSVPLKGILPGLDVGGYLGYMKISGSTIGIQSFSTGAFSGLLLFGPENDDSGSIFSWQGIKLSLGGGYSQGTLSMTVAPGPIYQDIPIDADGAGPLVPQIATISIEPSIDAGVRSIVAGARIFGSTGITLFNALKLSAGVGFSVAQGNSAISIEADEPITVKGYLAGLVETDGSISVSGTTAKTETFSFSPYLSSNISFRVGAFNIALPLVWNIKKGLGAAVLVELRPWN